MTQLPRNHLSPAFEFLAALQTHNSKTWFDAHRAEYLAAKERVEQLVDALIDDFRPIEDFANLTAKDCLFRINRDVRFAKDKSPYKTNFGAVIRSGGKHSVRAPYYIHLEPGQSMLAGGMYDPTPEQLALVRRAIDRDALPLQGIIRAKPFIKQFGGLAGERLKTVPKGYDRDHPALELLQFKQFIVMKPVTDDALLAPGVVKQMVDTFTTLKPLLDWLNSILLG